MEKKQFAIGLVTGVLITAFLVAVGLSAKIIYTNLHEKTEAIAEAEAREQTAQEISNNNKKKSSSTILSDEDFLKRLCLWRT